jgi:hypothetical protein
MPGLRFPWDSDPVVADTPALPATPPAPAKPRGRRPTGARAVRSGPAAVADCLYHHLTISGPADSVDRFADAARGSGVIPWRLDGAAIEEDIFVRAVSQPASRRSLTVSGCRILARQFRDRFEAHHARAIALVGCSLACPLDLHVLLPVPPTILQLGPTDPGSRAWLTQHWGTADRLRQVIRRPKPGMGRRLPTGQAVIGYGFFTVGDTPLAAVDRLAADWPALRFRLSPRPPD